MTVYLAPSEVVAKVGDGGVGDCTGVESWKVWWNQGVGREVGGPEAGVVGCKGREDGGEEFGGAAVEEGCGFVKDETISSSSGDG